MAILNFFNKNKKRVAELEQLVSQLQGQLEEAKHNYLEYEHKIVEKDEEIQSLTDSYEQRLSRLNKADSNEVTLRINDDLSEVSPIIRYKDGVYDILVQKQYISDGKDTSIQLGLMVVAHEALTQILDAFSETIKTD